MFPRFLKRLTNKVLHNNTGAISQSFPYCKEQTGVEIKKPKPQGSLSKVMSLEMLLNAKEPN